VREEEQELVKKSASLSRFAPREWAEFLSAMQNYGDALARVCVQSQPEHLQISQGRAQQCASLVALFGDAGKTADRIASKEAARAAVKRR
jgi:hypothetical protein